METCYEYLGCDKKDCVMHKLPRHYKCWEIDNTDCNHCGINLVRQKHAKKADACRSSGCIYYKIHGKCNT